MKGFEKVAGSSVRESSILGDANATGQGTNTGAQRGVLGVPYLLPSGMM